MATVSATGQSALDVAGIVQQLMTIERRPLTQYARQEAGHQAKISAYGTVKGVLSSFQGALGALNSLATYQGVKATSSDEDQFKVTAGTSAAPGNHTVRVTRLATNHIVASSNFASTDTTIGTGTITFQKGTFSGGVFTPNAEYPVQSIAIGTGQQTLAGVRDAVNAASIGITASIVNDGSGNRLVFASTDGASSSLKITVADDDGSNTNTAGLSRLAYDPAAAVNAGKNLTQMQAAQTATAIIDGITVTSQTNVVASAIEGLTFTLLATSSTAATAKIERDTAGTRSAVEGFVKAYNDAAKQLKEIAGYDAATKQAGPLQGDFTLRSLQSELRNLVTARITSTGTLQSLKDIGVALDKEGVLRLDTGKLDKQLAADPGAVAQLFARAGKPSDSRVTFLKAGAATQPGLYDVTVTQAATQGKLTGNQNAGLTITAGVNDTLSITVDGVQATIVLPATTYANRNDLAADLQSRINANTTLSSANASVAVANASNKLTVTSGRQGGSSSIAASGNAAQTLFGNNPAATAGTDVAGTIGGEAALGVGQTLTSTAGAARGLELQVTAAAPGSLGTVRFFQGISANLDARLTELLGSNGPIRARTDGLDQSIKAIARRTQVFNDRMLQVERRLFKQYSALDAMLQSMASTSTYLQQQLTQLAANTRSV